MIYFYIYVRDVCEENNKNFCINMILISNIVNYLDNYFMEMYQVRKYLFFNGYIYYILYKEMLLYIDVFILLNKN